MSDLAVTRTVQRVELDANAVLKQAWRLYRRLFTRSVLMGAIVFGVVQFLPALARSNPRYAGVALLAVVLNLLGLALLEGGLVEIVRGLHVDGDDDASALAALRRSAGRLGKLVRVSLLTALGLGAGFILFVIPGLVLMTRWAVAVPVAMLEEGNARDALRRSRAIVSGNGWSVLKVLFGAGVLQLPVWIVLTVVGTRTGAFGWWATSTVCSALAVPYYAHAQTIVYFALQQPDRPIVLDPGERWQSVWDEQDARPVAEEGEARPAESIEDEYQRRFDERDRRWNG